MRRGMIFLLLFRRFSVLSFLEKCPCLLLNPMYQGARLFCSRPPRLYKEEPTELAYIDILANSKIRLDSVKRMTQIQNTS